MNTTKALRPELSEPHQEIRKILSECRQRLERGRESELYGFAWYEEKHAHSAEISRTVNTGDTFDKGVVFRLMCDGKQYESATNQLDREHLLTTADSLRAQVDKAHPSVNKRPMVPTTWQQELAVGLPTELREQIPQHPTATAHVHFAPRCEQSLQDINTQTCLTLAKRVREQALQLASETSGTIDGASELADIQVMVRFRVTCNIFVDREKSMSQILPVAMLAGGGMTRSGQSARLVKGGLGTLELIETNAEDLRQMGVVPQELSAAPKLKPGRYPVITGPGLSGVIAHEAFGHTQEGDTWMKGRSMATRLHADGIRVGNDMATIVNNPAVYSMDGQQAGSNGSYYFDHEGQLARPQVILDQGLLSGPMTDLTSAQLLNMTRTANGKRESWRRPLMARQTNTFFTPGDQTLEELIAQVDYGFLARYPHGGMEDPKGGSLTAGAAYFEEIKQGKLTGQLFIGPSGGHIELTDSVFDVLEKIQGKTSVTHPDSTPVISPGGCGKYHKELVEAGVGGPFILWNQINCG